jgi:hypothetical protein
MSPTLASTSAVTGPVVVVPSMAAPHMQGASSCCHPAAHSGPPANHVVASGSAWHMTRCRVLIVELFWNRLRMRPGIRCCS